MENFDPIEFGQLYRSLSVDEQDAFIKSLSPEEAEAVEKSAWWWITARDEQLPPPGDWRFWLLLGGRGLGKTISITQWAHAKALSLPGSRGIIVAATAGDMRDAILNGPSGILVKTPEHERPHHSPTYNLLQWPNGSTAILRSAEEPNRFRGPGTMWAICDEFASWRYPESFDQMLFGLREGDNPQCAIATTPKPVKHMQELLKRPGLVKTTGSTYDNEANLSKAWFKDIIAKYKGTRLGRQELDGEMLDDDLGALWKMELIESARIFDPALVPDLDRVLVAIDPAVTSNEESSETGIMVGGMALIDGVKHAYILDDLTLKGSPEEWARVAIDAYKDNRADAIVVEVNNGGDLVKSVIRAVDPDPRIIEVRASRGKVSRAEPVVAYYEQCISGGALIETDHGRVPIREVTIQDRVWTRKGLKRVLWSGTTGIKPTIELTTLDGGKLTCTDDHPILTGRGFVSAGQVVPRSDIIWVCENNISAQIARSQLPEKTFAADPAQLSIAGSMIANQSVSTSCLMDSGTISYPTGIFVQDDLKEIACSIETFMRMSMEKYWNTSIFTTSAEIIPIIGSRILSRFLRAIMRKCICVTRTPRSSRKEYLKTKSSGGYAGVYPNMSVIGAKKNFLPQQHGFDSALLPVTRISGIMKQRSSGEVPVYNLEVEDQPEFFANGILVHNSRVHHLGVLTALETQQTEWMVGQKSPDRLDSLVWLITALLESVGDSVSMRQGTARHVARTSAYSSGFPQR